MDEKETLQEDPRVAINLGPTEELSRVSIPSASEILMHHDVRIRVCSSGALITIGCKDIAFSTIEEALEEVNFYYKDPVESYKKWTKRFI